MKIEGTIWKKFDKNVVSDKFTKQEVVILDNSGMYEQHILVQFTQDRCDLLNVFKVGDKVSVSINLKGREWTNPQGEVKYFNTIEGWKIDSDGDEPPQQQSTGLEGTNIEVPGDDDLPF